MKSKKLTFVPQNNISIGATYDKTYKNFGIYVYKNHEYGVGDKLLSDHIQGMIEMGGGAHYYAQGRASYEFESAEAFIDLERIAKTKQMDTCDGKRTACIALSVQGGASHGSCDVGISCTNGTDWYPNIYSWNYTEGDWNMKGAPIAGAKACTIHVTVTREGQWDCIQAEYIFQLATPKTQKISHRFVAPAGTIFGLSNGSSGLPSFRFTRFMSLIPNGGFSIENDPADGSCLPEGNMSGLKLFYHDGRVIDWTMDFLDYIWSVQGWNIPSCSISDSGDTCSIEHKNFVYTRFRETSPDDIEFL